MLSSCMKQMAVAAAVIFLATTSAAASDIAIVLSGGSQVGVQSGYVVGGYSMHSRLRRFPRHGWRGNDEAYNWRRFHDANRYSRHRPWWPYNGGGSFGYTYYYGYQFDDNRHYSRTTSSEVSCSEPMLGSGRHCCDGKQGSFNPYAYKFPAY